MQAVLMISHGSRSPKTIDEVKQTLCDIAGKIDVPIMQYAFLELQSPSIPEGIDLCVRKGATKILILLNFLNAGRHVDVDIPDMIRQAQSQYPHVSMTISNPLGLHPGIVDLFVDIIKRSS